MGKGGQTIGYHYILSRADGLCRGPINELVEIDVGDEVAWQGSVTDDTPTAINAPDLFGGEEREGGVQGAFRLLMGASDQVLPDTSATVSVGSTGPVQSTTVPGLKTLVTGKIGEMRGFLTLMWDGLMCSISPYPKEWKYRLRRHSAGWYGGTCWYPAKARVLLTGDGNYPTAPAEQIEPESAAGVFGALIAANVEAAAARVPIPNSSIHAMNPAHIIYQVLTDPQWGAGQPIESINENSFIHAANTLCSELFGLCFMWSRQGTVEEFLQVVIDHIAAVLYTDRETGKWTLRLIRDDYVADDLPLYTLGTGLLSIEAEEAASSEEQVNEIRVTGHDPVTNDPFEVRVKSPGAVAANGGEVISDTRDYKGIPTRALALQVGMRDLRAVASGLKRYRVTLDRRAWRLTPGTPFRVSVPSRGIDEVILRAGMVDYGTLTDGRIDVRAIEDVFGMPTSSFVSATPGTYRKPALFPLPSPQRAMVEANYRDIYRLVGADRAAEVLDTSSRILQFAVAPVRAATQYDLASKASGEANYTFTANQNYTGFAALAASIGPADTAIEVATVFDIDDDFIGSAVLIGSDEGEIVRLEAIAGTTWTVARGCADTVPRSHEAGSQLWGQDDTPATDARDYAEGETVSTQVLMRTSTARLDPADAPVDTLVLVGRHARPYPPAAVTVDSVSCYALVDLHPAPAIDWVARNRLTQADQLIAFGEGAVAAEAGTTYRIRVYDEGDLVTPLRTVSGLSAGPWTYDGTMQTADGNPVAVEVALDAQRDGLDSWQAQQFRVNLVGGYGYAYGMDYGGA